MSGSRASAIAKAFDRQSSVRSSTRMWVLSGRVPGGQTGPCERLTTGVRPEPNRLLLPGSPKSGMPEPPPPGSSGRGSSGGEIPGGTSQFSSPGVAGGGDPPNGPSEGPPDGGSPSGGGPPCWGGGSPCGGGRPASPPPPGGGAPASPPPPSPPPRLPESPRRCGGRALALSPCGCRCSEGKLPLPPPVPDPLPLVSGFAVGLSGFRFSQSDASMPRLGGGKLVRLPHHIQESADLICRVA